MADPQLVHSTFSTFVSFGLCLDEGKCTREILIFYLLLSDMLLIKNFYWAIHPERFSHAKVAWRTIETRDLTIQKQFSSSNGLSTKKQQNNK